MITPGKRRKGSRRGANTRACEPDERSPMEQRVAMTWARRLKRVFSIDTLGTALAYRVGAGTGGLSREHHCTRHHGRCDQQGLQDGVRIRYGTAGIADGNVGEFSRNQGFSGPLAMGNR